MSGKNKSSRLGTLIKDANNCRSEINQAIDIEDNIKTDILSIQYENLIEAVFSETISCPSDFTLKCEFGQKILSQDHSNPVLVKSIFESLSVDAHNIR